jgi:spermidine synthase
MSRFNRLNLIVLLCFFVSGAAGLIYQICWIRSAALIFGSTTFALSTVLAVFFSGMAAGSYLSGHFSRCTTKPLLWYAVIEVLLASYALSTPYLFDFVNFIYDIAFEVVQFRPNLGIALRLLLVLLVLFIPALLLGATLPLFCRQMVTSNHRIASEIGVLYTVNTLGAAVGCMLAGFYLIPELGVSSSIAAGAALNIAAALIALYLALHGLLNTSLTKTLPDAIDKQPIANNSNQSVHLITALFFLSGLVAIGNEVLWTRFLGLLIHNTIYTYTITLSVVLAGIALGSLVAASIFDKYPYLKIFGYFQIVSALLNMAFMLSPSQFWLQLGTGFIPFIILMLIPAFISGLCFPLVMRLVTSNARFSSVNVGSMMAYNILGGVLGSLLIGFWILPYLGLQTGVLLLSLIGVICGSIALLRDRVKQTIGFSWTVISLSLISWFTLMLLGNRLPEDYLGPKNLLIDYQEGYGSLLSVHWQGETKVLQSDRLWQGADVKNHQVMAAHVPMILHTDPKQILVVGLGVGQTASRFLMYGINHLDIVDIEPALFPFIKRNFDTDWMNDQRVNLLAEDGRMYVNHTANKYDVISIEVGQVFRPGTDVFYTQEFYQQARQRLNENGLVIQFVPLAFFGQQELRSVLATFQSVFPESALWYNTQEMLLIGSVKAPIKLKPHRLALLQSNDTIKTDLQYSYWGGQDHWLNQTQNFLAGFMSGSREVQQIAGTAPIYIDNHPVLAYATSHSDMFDRSEKQLTKLLAGNLTSVEEIYNGDLSPDMVKKVEYQRDNNINNLLAETYLADAIAAESTDSPHTILGIVDQALTFNPYNFMANRMKATLFLRTSQPDKAVFWFKKALELNTENIIARRGLAFAYLQSGHAGDALIHARKVFNKRPDDAIILRTMGLALAASNRIKEAIPYLKKSVTIDPEDDIAHKALNLATQYVNTLQ